MRHSFNSLWVLLALSPLTFAQGVGPDAARVEAAKTLQELRGSVAVRWDRETGTPASLRFRAETQPLDGASVAVVARWVEQELAPLFEPGLRVADRPQLAPLTGSVLVYATTHDLGSGRVRIDLHQTVGGLRVLDAGMWIELVQQGELLAPVSVRARYYTGVPARIAQGLSGQVAAQLQERFPPLETADLYAPTTHTTVVVPTEAGFRPVYAVLASTASVTEGERCEEIHVDAVTGVELRRIKRSCSAVARGQSYDKNPGESQRARVPLANLYVFQGNNRVTTNAQGVHNLTGMVNLDEGLSGPRVRIFVSREEELTYSGPADIDLNPAANSNAQTELAAYTHFMSFNAHLRATYPRFAASNVTNRRFPVIVKYKNGNGQPVRNAFFSPQSATAGGDTFPNGYIGMGTFNGREAARSSSVLQHEYCHALYQGIVRLSGSTQAGGLNEGLADYLPSAFKDDPRIGFWLTDPVIRDLRRKLVWPADNNNEVHRVGHIFAGALWRARTAAEARDPADRLRVDQAVVEGIFRLRDRPTLIDAREAILDGDQAVNNGANRVTLSDAFAEHGIGPRAQNDGPTIAPLADVATQTGSTLTLQVTATDPDGDPVRISTSPLSNSSYDAATDTFSFTANASQIGAHQVTFTASDEEFSDSTTITITVTQGTQVPITPGTGMAPITSGVATQSTSGASTANALNGGGGGGGGGGGCSLAPSAPGAPAAPLFPLLFAGLILLRLRSNRV